LNEYIITDMKPEHIDDIECIEKLSFRTPWSKEALRAELSNNCAVYRVLLQGGRLAAYGGMWVIIDEAHITNIAVHPDYRGRGFGDAVLEDMIKCADKQNITAMTLEVRTSNMPAFNLYTKHGFAEAGRRKGYYSDTGEDAIIMWRQNKS
jgi:ribosomal-protein-alanine N-acetyltransferase